MTNKEKKLSLRESAALNYRAFRLLRRHLPGLLNAMLLDGLVTGLTPYVGIYLSAQILNQLGGERNSQAIWTWVTAALVATAILALAKAACSRWISLHGTLRWHILQKIYTDKLLRMDFCVLDEQKTHDLYSQILQNNNWMGWGLNKVIGMFQETVRSCVGIVSAVALTASLFTLRVPEESSFAFLNHPLFGPAFAALLLFIALLSGWLSAKAERFWVNCANDEKMENRLFFFWGGDVHQRSRMMDARIYNQQDLTRFYMNMETFFSRKSSMTELAVGRMGLTRALSSAVSASFTGFAYLFVCLKSWAGAFGVGSVTQYVGSITALSTGITQLMRTLGDIRNNGEFLKTTFAFLDLPDRMYQGTLTTEKRSDRQYEVEFRDVSFRYPGSDVYALRHVSLRFQVGQRLAVVGENGSGKTTFIKLLCRLYDPTEGQILLNGIDIRKYRYQDYLQVFSVVFQDFQLLAFPLGQNVAASEKFDPQRVRSCLEMAGFGERLAQMPEGLDTYLYKDFEKTGVEISGGEGQKIALARALYKDAPFIVLDEPTAALDPIAEYEIYSKFNQLVGDKTAIYISHRLSSCRFCDQILVFHQGRLVQKGSHQQLVEQTGGKYRQLWTAQAQYYTK